MNLSFDNLVIQKTPWHANMTEMNHLGRALIAKPEVFGPAMRKIFSSYRYSDNPLTSLLGGPGKEKVITTSEWEYKLRGASTRPLISKGNANAAGITQPGIMKTEFFLWLDENWYVPGDELTPGVSDSRYLVRVQGTPTRKGGGWLYPVILVTTSSTLYMPLVYLKAGKKWGKMFSQYEEGATQSSSTQFALPMSLASRLSKYRKHMMITDEAQTSVLSVKIPDSTGKMHSTWFNYAETEFWEQYYRELERGYWYSRSSDVLGSTGRTIKSGPGVFELMEYSNTQYFSNFSAKLLEDYLMSMLYSRVKPGSKRKLKVFSGEYGMMNFNNAVNNHFRSSGFVVMDSMLIEKENSPYHSNGLSYGAQFFRYKAGNGIEVELIHEPFFDDQEINFEIDPILGYPTNSMRYVFMDLTGDGMEQNIQLVRRKDQHFLNYVVGTIGPYGPIQSGFSAHAGGYYEMHAGDSTGVHIEDPTGLGQLVFRRA